ncbi:MAG TPA: integrase [Eggerthellaceae bacterium]|nr:integrase [Eggerthellaceae bacterium]
MAGRRVLTRAAKAGRGQAGQQRQPHGRAEGEEALPCADLLDDFVDSLRIEQGASEHTVRSYRTDLEAFLRWCVRAGVDPLHAEHRQLRSYLGELDAARYARTTINRHLSSLRGFYRWMIIAGVIQSDPASALAGPRQTRHLPHVLQRDDMLRLLCVHAAVDATGEAREQTPADMRDQALLEFLYACGARISEASSLRLEDVDFAAQQVKVFGKGRKERIIPLHRMCLQALHRYLDEARPELLNGSATDRFFVSNRGKPMSADSMRKMFKATVRAAGLDDRLSPHDMRHTFATDLLAGEADLRSVQEMLGHATLSTTQIYTHLSPERLKAVHGQSHPRA